MKTILLFASFTFVAVQTARAATITVTSTATTRLDYWRGALARGVCLLLLAFVSVTRVAADWTPPESSVTPPAVVTLDAFAAPDLNGAEPRAALVVGPDGALYGSTTSGGTNNSFGAGTLFRLETNGTFTKLHDFNGTDGFAPFAALVVGPDGALYGSTYSGGTNNDGTLFRLETNGTFTKLHDFTALTDGQYPEAALVAGPDGALYGSTGGGGTDGAGTLFRLETNGTFTKLHEFQQFIDGYYPFTPLVVGSDGALYGSTLAGGTNGFGTLFRLETDGTFTTLHDFHYNGGDGYFPVAALVVGPDGALYGSTGGGGTNSSGTLFRLETNGSYTRLHDFNDTDGYNPSAALVVGSDGALYGSTAGGGTNSRGTLFRLETNGTFTKLHDFTLADGAETQTALVVGSDGALYGPTHFSGANGFGTLFRLEINGAFTKLYDFNGTITLFVPPPALVAGPDGALYSSTPYGGSGNRGILFKIVLTFTSPDSDDDGIPDTIDQCPDTPPGAVVNSTGCSIAQLVPCEGPQSGGTWKNHGQYVSAVVEVAKDFLNAGLITRKHRTEIVTGAAHSDCGKRP